MLWINSEAMMKLIAMLQMVQKAFHPALIAAPPWKH